MYEKSPKGSEVYAATEHRAHMYEVFLSQF